MIQTYDNLIIGASLEGMLLAKKFSENKESVLVTEETNLLGQYQRVIQAKGKQLKQSLQIFPDTPKLQETLSFISSFLDKPVTFKPISILPQTFQEGEFSNFIDFIDKIPNCHEEIAPYLTSSFIELSPPPSEWIGSLNTIHTLTGTQVTNIDFSKNEAILNGTEKISFKKCLLAISPKRVKFKLPLETLSPRTLKQFNTSKHWDRVSLDIWHKETSSLKLTPFFILSDDKKEILPHLGHFEPTETNVEGESSHWEFFVPHQDSRASELGMRALRKQLKKVFQIDSSSIFFEKISLWPATSGYMGTDFETGRWPNIENFFLASCVAAKGGTLEAQLSFTQYMSELFSTHKS